MYKQPPRYPLRRYFKLLRYGVLTCFIWLLIIQGVPALQHSIVGPTLILSTEQLVDEGMVSDAYSTVDPGDLHKQGQVAYEQGQLTAAVEYWQMAVNKFAVVGDKRSQALTLGHLAIAQQDLGDWNTATATLEQAHQLADEIGDAFVFAQIAMVEGSQALHQGQGEAALVSWQQAEKWYMAIADESGILQSQLNQLQALQSLGHYHQSTKILKQMEETLNTLPPSVLKVNGLHNLGQTLQATGEWQEAGDILTQSLTLAESLQLATTADIHLSLGNLFRAQNASTRAIQHYQAAANSPYPRTQLTAQLNHLRLLVDQNKTSEAFDSTMSSAFSGPTQTANALLPTIETLLPQQPPSRTTVYAYVNLAESLITLHTPNDQGANSPTAQLSKIAQYLTTAIAQARSLNDTQAEAYALGELGHLYEVNHQWSEALDLTRAAIQLAKQVQATAIAMPWQWQQGRILKQQGDRHGAIAAYEDAVTSLKELRQDLVSLSPDIQYSFRENVEPVYRELVELQLTDIDDSADKQQRLKRSRQLIEDLKLAGLDNFFRRACLQPEPQAIDNIDSHAAVIYPIFLNEGTPDQRLDVIVSLPNIEGNGKSNNLSGGSSGDDIELMHYSNAIAPYVSQQIFNELPATLTPLYDADEILPLVQQLYKWLIEPAETEFVQRSVQTLVFVLDGPLRGVPISALHDGKQFLLEKYTIALSPGLQLLPPTSDQPLAIADKLSVLTSGLSQERPGFTPLPNVEKEIQQIQQLLPTNVLLNEKFVEHQVESRLENNPFSIVHFATHGQFSSNLEDTFLLTWNDQLDIHELDTLLSNRTDPIELLILSACQTARGDDRAVLGLAGMAVQTGAKSTLATLWSVADASTAQLMSVFYQKLLNQTTKAEALRQAQISLLQSDDYHHPYFWAPFVLVGNWY